MQLRRIIAVLTVSVVLCAPALGAVYNLTPSDDWFSVISGSGLQPGDEVILGGGTYQTSSWLPMGHQGTAENPIIIRAADGETPVISKTTNTKNGIDMMGAQYLELRGLTITSCSSGIRIMKNSVGDYAKFITIADSHIYNIDGVGITANHTGQTYQGMIFRGNEIHDTGDVGEGFYLGSNYNGSQFYDGLIEGNYIHDLNGPGVSQGDGIEIKLGSYNNIVRDNVIHDTNYPGVLVYGTAGHSDQPNIIERNVIWNTNDAGIQAASDAIIRNNIIINAGGSGIQSHEHQGAIPGNLQIINNTIIQENGNSIIYISSSSGTSGPIVVANNAVYRNGATTGIYTPPGSVVVNNYWSTDLAADFSNVAAHDVFPVAGSGVIGAASATYIPTDDFNATPRDWTLDAGAYVYDPAGNPGWQVAPEFKVLEPGTAPAPVTINYMLKINGQDVESITPADVTPGEQFTVEIYANCPDSDLGSNLNGGVLQYTVNLGDSNGALTPDQGPGAPPEFLPNGNWDSQSASPMSNYAGEVDSNGSDVLGQAGAISPTAFNANYSTFGAGPDIYDLVGLGTFVWDGSDTVLTLTPGALTAQLVFGLDGPGGLPGAHNPDVANGDSISFLALTLIAGDADADGDVDGVDLATLGVNWDPAGVDKTWADGDFDGDGDVDGSDLAAVGVNWNPAGSSVPEPTVMALLAIGAVAALRRRA